MTRGGWGVRTVDTTNARSVEGGQRSRRTNGCCGIKKGTSVGHPAYVGLPPWSREYHTGSRVFRRTSLSFAKYWSRKADIANGTRLFWHRKDAEEISEQLNPTLLYQRPISKVVSVANQIRSSHEISRNSLP